MAKSYWLVDVTEWGEVVVYDTEERAEAWRRDKANWEGCIARKQEITKEEADEWLAERSFRRLINGDGNDE